MMCGVYTRLMSVRERTSIELPSALSGSNELMARPGVASTRTVTTRAGCGGAWARAAVVSAININVSWGDFRTRFMTPF